MSMASTDNGSARSVGGVSSVLVYNTSSQKHRMYM